MGSFNETNDSFNNSSNKNDSEKNNGEISESIKQFLFDANEELKRVEHLIYVSLKYTRTVDVILNILQRLVDAYSFMVDALLEKAKEENKVIEEPTSAIERAQLLTKLYDDEEIIDNMELYLLLRKLLRAKNIDRENEYRRHVTMKTIIDGREEVVDIDIITNYYLFAKEFIEFLFKKFGMELLKREGEFW